MSIPHIATSEIHSQPSSHIRAQSEVNFNFSHIQITIQNLNIFLQEKEDKFYHK